MHKLEYPEEYLFFFCFFFVVVFCCCFFFFFFFFFFCLFFARVSPSNYFKRTLDHGLSACTGDNPLDTLVDYLPVQADKPWCNIYTTLTSVDLAQYEIFRAKVCDLWQGWYRFMFMILSADSFL